MNLTKSKYRTGLFCPKILWLEKNMPESFEQSTVDENRLDTGIKVGKLAREFFGVYEEVPFTADKNVMITETRRLLDAGTKVICEASFAFDGNFCSSDILRRVRGGYELIEVKSSTGSPGENANRIEAVNFDDLAFQLYVIRNCGVKLRKISIMQLNREYVRRGDLDIQALFVLTDCTETVVELQHEIADSIAQIKKLAEQADEPEMRVDSGCKGCGFTSWCFRDFPEDNVFNIGWGMRSSKKDEAFGAGIVSFEDALNGGIELSEKQKRQVETVVNNLPPHVDKTAIREFLSQVKYPLYHLDFETYQQAIPLWDEVSPYTQIPFQYSLHIQDSPRGSASHKEFLSEAGVDPRRELAERLCSDIPADACVLAYSMSFEKRVIHGLIRLFPDLHRHLSRINDNMIDLIVPFRSGAYYCREMGGSYSIKKVLPALFPDDLELDYEALSIVRNGGDAMAAFATLHEKTPEEIAEIRSALLAYCRLDTLAMVRILDRLYDVCGS